MKNYLFVFMFLVALVSAATAQESPKSSTHSYFGKNKLEKKFRWGFVFNSGWSTFRDADTVGVFTKPSLGGYLKMEYNPQPWIGLSIGVGHQQMGTGVLTPDFDKSLGNPDSTHRLRLRSNNLSIPIQIELRSPKEVFENGKIVLALGIVPNYVYDARTVFHSVEDGFHERTTVTDNFTKRDLLYRASVGVDVNAVNSSLFKVNLIAQYGTKNTYNFPGLTRAVGRNLLFGIEFGVMF